MQSWISRNLILWPATLLKGERIRPYLREYRATQWLTGEQLRARQDGDLRQLLRHAATGSAFHRARWQLPESLDLRTQGELLGQLPTMSKADLSGNFGQIVVTASSKGATRKTTGGSTGQPVTLLKNNDALARERAATYRAYEWAGVEPGAPQARFWGVPHTRSRRAYYTVADIVANRRRFSAFNFNEESLARYFKELCTFRPKYLYGYVSMVQQFAQYVRDTKQRLPDSVVAIITTSEVLSDAIRAELQSCLGVPVFNEYGCGEVGSIAHECERGQLHVMAENMIVEVLDDQGRSAQQGELVVTDLHNRATPLIRYRLGDFATVANEPCECGRGLARIERVHGRAYDFVRTPDGLRVHPEAVIYVFEMMKESGVPLRQFQVEQTQLDTLAVRLVSGSDLTDEHEQLIQRLLHEHVSRLFRIEISRVDAIPRERSGKLRLVKSSLPVAAN